MELEKITQFLEHKTVLVTGATGFLAKVFLEKLLRVQPNVKKLYLLLRAADTSSVNQRFYNEVIGKDLFRVVKEKLGANLNSIIAKKIAIVPGDVSYEDLGAKDSSLREEMINDLDFILNFAATTRFDERYDVALGTNALGAKNVLCFAKNCLKLKLFIHISTAYVCGESSGLIMEKSYQLGETLNGVLGLNIEEEKKLIDRKLNQLRREGATEANIKKAMIDMGTERAKAYGWPNTYVFTKAMGEMVIGHLKENLPVVIIRPTMVTSTWREPFPGWIEGARTIDALTVGYGSGKMSFFVADLTAIVDVVLKLANTISCHYFQGTYNNLNRNIKRVMRLVELYQPYLFFHGIFDDSNTNKLLRIAKDNGMETNNFFFGVKSIDWDDYFINTHIPGILKYVLK
ncbi:hypothetical protein JCGZ_10586 [Jatropha curcas]|uniref:Fatty acyl-CoA reductase n=1 Tax=Jatropha curcas TaxID=180498 RepID=A0A067KF18_JATCU|nr:hypothetical protein JCGZ_10586 [Jatropha curcas]